MKGHEKLTLLLCLIWTATILYGEMFSFYMPFLFSCSWPHLSSSSSSNPTMNGKGYAADYVKVAVIADPQIMDKTSLRLPSKSLALEFVQFYTDLFMRRAFFSSILPFKPEVILFLGDYFDGGPYLSDDEWQESLSRLKHMFGLNTEEIHSTVKVYHLPGNHDIGYATLQSHKPEGHLIFWVDICPLVFEKGSLTLHPLPRIKKEVLLQQLGILLATSHQIVNYTQEFC